LEAAMKKTDKKHTIFRWVIEIGALALFILLTVQHRLQLWLFIFLTGAAVSVFAGRLFCGWICPMNTVFRCINWIYGKLKIKRFSPPAFFSKNWFRYSIVIIFIAAMAAVRVMNIRINLFLYITLASILVTLLFTEDFWHRHICPFGTILSITSRKAPLSMKIDEAGCISCGKCQSVCPAASIITKEDTKRQNRKHECLLCYQCVSVCPTGVCNVKV
jgi:polyferredoxin